MASLGPMCPFLCDGNNHFLTQVAMLLAVAVQWIMCMVDALNVAYRCLTSPCTILWYSNHVMNEPALTLTLNPTPELEPKHEPRA